MSLSAAIPSDRIQKKTTRFKGNQVTVWKGHRVTKTTFAEIHDKGLYLVNGTHKDMLREANTPRFVCAVRDHNKAIMSYTMLIDGSDAVDGVRGVEGKGVLGMLGTYTGYPNEGKGWAKQALQLMVREILTSEPTPDDQGKLHVFVQYHVYEAFEKIIRQASKGRIAVHSFGYCNDLTMKLEWARKWGMDAHFPEEAKLAA